MNETTSLRLRNIQVRAGNLLILDLPELTLRRGEILAIVGPNGAGKSTLLQVAGLLRRPDAGEIYLADTLATPKNEPELRRTMSMVVQAPLLFDVGVLGNAASGLRFRGVRRAEAERHARQWLEHFEVAGLAGRGVRGLSAGEAQRVSLARAFATEPSLLLLDEPFAPLDAPTRVHLVPEVGRVIRESRASAIVVTHHLWEAEALADRVGIMEGGTILQIGALAELEQRPVSERVAHFLHYARLGPVRG